MPQPFTQLISVPELATLATPAWRIFDCRFNLADPPAGRAGYTAGHLPGAFYLDLEEDLSGPVSGLNGRHPLPDPPLLADKLGSLGVAPGTQVVVSTCTSYPFVSTTRGHFYLGQRGHYCLGVTVKIFGSICC